MRYLLQAILAALLSVSFFGCGKKVVPLENKYKTKFCRYCGGEMPNDALFCSICGANEFNN